MANSSSESNAIIATPTGGGALVGIGEKFSPDLHSGTGNFTIPITLPPGRNGFQPQLSLAYSTGNGSGPFGLGWALSVPGISRKTSKGIPRYDEDEDVYLLSGAEDLVPIEKSGSTTRYRPRTEGLFAQILRHRDATNNYWEVRSTDGLRSIYGTPASFRTDPATIADPSSPTHVFSWKLTQTEDQFGNRIEYQYLRDTGLDGPHRWDQIDLAKIQYVDYGEDRVNPKFLVSVEFVYELRPDPHSEYRSGFEIRTRKRCTQIVVRTHAEQDQVVRTYDLIYLDQRPDLSSTLPLNGVSLLSQVKLTGIDGDRKENLPPLEFTYTNFQPAKRNFFSLSGPDLPAQSLASSDLELVDLFGNGLPDLLQMNGTVRYWRNLGGGKFALPRFMKDAPAGLTFADPDVQLIDANGDGRTDLLIANGVLSGYFPLRFGGQWDRESFRRYRQAPSFNLEDPEVMLVDLDGDGITDAVRSGSRLECFFQDPSQGWATTRWVDRKSLDVFPNVNFSDPRVRWADFTGDGLQTIALVYDGNVEYWPHFGRGSFGKRIHMQNSPRFPHDYDPRRILVGDVDGDGLADIVYVDDSKVTLWINKSGNGWSNPITISGTPAVSDFDSVRLADVLGSGISGVLWSRDANGVSRDHMFFLDFTGSLKPYLLTEMDNHIGAVTRVEYTSSTKFYLEDQKRRETAWKTTLPFPVHVVSRVEIIDHFSGGKLTTEYHYHHGHWDGGEREFRGFGMVEVRDSESFEDYHASGLHNAETPFARVDRRHFSPPLLSKTWFHQGPVGDEFGDWEELDWSTEYWSGDPQQLRHSELVNQFLRALPTTPNVRRVRRDALRALQGSVLRTELYSLDGSDREKRPYTVSESSYGLEELEPPPANAPQRPHVFFPHPNAQRTTHWERGNDPMSQFSFNRYTDDGGALDRFGRPLAQTQIACPRGWRAMDDRPAESYLASRSCTVYCEPIDPQIYIHDRVAKQTSYEITGTGNHRVLELAAIKDTDATLKLIGQVRSFYDGEAFTGLPLKQIGKFGAVTRTESLVFTEVILRDAYGAEVPAYLEPTGNPVWTADYPLEFRSLLPRRAGYAFHEGSADPADPKGYFANNDRRRYDFQTNPAGSGRGLVLEALGSLSETANPLAHRILITYDKYELLPEQATNAVGLVTAAKYDYRVFKPGEVTDSNGNKSRFTFSPMGLLQSSFISGKTRGEGDQIRPSSRSEFGFLAFTESRPESRQPIFVRTISHSHHDTELDVALPERDETIVTVEYSDGFGRLLQTRAQAEDEHFGDAQFGGGDSLLPASQSAGPGGEVAGRKPLDGRRPNVVVTGWQTYDNKGRVVEQWEPFFSEGWEYGQPTDIDTGQKVVTFFDPRGNAIRSVNPDGSEQLVVGGVPGSIVSPNLTDPRVFEPTPWEAYTYDVNDNAGRTHPDSSSSYSHQWNTPSSIVIDALGRTVETVSRNRDPSAAAGDPLPPIQEFRTRTTYDIQGYPLLVRDAIATLGAPLGRTAFQYFYDHTGRKLRIESIDSGKRTIVLDAGGGVIEQRDAKGAIILLGYDQLNRPLRLWARDGEGQAMTLRHRLEYGDGSSANQPAAERAINRNANRLGKLGRHFDEAGLLTLVSYDFKGNLLEKTRRVVSDTAILGSFAGPPAGWEVKAFRVDWTNPAEDTLDPTTFTSTVTYDALSRVKAMTYPKDVENGRRRFLPHYSRAGKLAHVALERDTPGGPITETFVDRIAYDAKGQRVLIAYGNRIMTRHAYDPRTARPARVRTESYQKPSELTYRHVGEPQQDVAFQYDLAGNILKLEERVPGCGILNTPQGGDALDRVFTYDALSRLRSATGRECDRAPEPPPWDERPRCTDQTLTRGYTERYKYDSVGNVVALNHVTEALSFNRTFELEPGSNRLHKWTSGQNSFDYVYDPNGNLIRETTSRHFEWDYADRMRVFRTQTSAAEPSVHAHYLYDSVGQRVKKFVRKQGGQVEVTVYIDGIFEYQRIVRPGAIEENNTLHVMDDQSRIALVRVGNAFSQDNTPAVKYHLGDHLGSSQLVLDGEGNQVNREEYSPYGETTFGSFARKRYRFSGKERDEESGLNYHKARYYACWLARWTSCDPAGPVAGLSLYPYSQNPLSFADPEGAEPHCTTQTTSSFPSEGGSSGIHVEGSMTICHSAASSGSTASQAPASAPALPAVTPAPAPPAAEPPTSPVAPPPSAAPAPPSEAARVPPMGVSFTYPPSKNDLFPPVQSVDTGSDTLNYVASIWASWSNVISVIPNMQSRLRAEGEKVLDSVAREFNFHQELQNAPYVLPMVRVEGVGPAMQAARVYAGAAARSLVFMLMGTEGGGTALIKVRIPLTYITYILRNALNIRYVGRARGRGTPEQVLYSRLGKGHDVWKEYAEAEDLRAEVLAVHQSEAASMGAESVYHDYFKTLGEPLLNDPLTPPLSSRPDKLANTRERIKAFFSLIFW